MRREEQNLISGQIPEWKMKLSYFYVNNKTLMKRGFVFLFFLLDVIIVFLFGRIFLNYQALSEANDTQMRLMSVNLINHEIVKLMIEPDPLIIGNTYSIKTKDQYYDLLALAQNSSKNWAIVEIGYTFIVNKKELGSRSTFILPNSSKYLTAFNVLGGQDAECKILYTNWKRTTDYTLLSYKDSIKSSGANYAYSSSNSLGGQAAFTLINESPYGFWEVGFEIVLFNRYQEPIGINYLSVDKLMARETRDIKFGWINGPSAPVAKIEVYPEINFLNSDDIMKIDAPIGSPPGRDN
ncbi:hypothetical protein AUJ29_01480 [Candidatus Kuenenbacteria bacterium CG1_02_38_13]|uniref:Uncharacterized protein n=2 Tax=Candidatus Kueneniibacteriota TaxID=1752740 RepID=A0A1J4U416_9BACT|nr:MAG: hypothetical protein AUJ29_01480 [Candidatus Kuenenbacteria bacterium CG1_02_38_13]